MHGISGFKVELIEKEVDTNPKEVDTLVEICNGGIYISPKGYGDLHSKDGHGCPIMIEIWDGELRVVVWSDINKEDPTHIISLEGAKEELRNDNDN